MSFYFPDGNGGRRIIKTGSGETPAPSPPSQQGAVIFCGTIGSNEILNQVASTEGRTGDMWILAFDNAASNIYNGDLLLCDGGEWRLLGISTRRHSYSLPTASNSIKGGVMIGEGLYMDGDTLNVSVTSSDNADTPSADTVAPSTPASNEKECSINIKNILKGSGGGSGGDYYDFVLGTSPRTVEGGMWLSV